MQVEALPHQLTLFLSGARFAARLEPWTVEVPELQQYPEAGLMGFGHVADPSLGRQHRGRPCLRFAFGPHLWRNYFERKAATGSRAGSAFGAGRGGDSARRGIRMPSAPAGRTAPAVKIDASVQQRPIFLSNPRNSWHCRPELLEPRMEIGLGCAEASEWRWTPTTSR